MADYSSGTGAVTTHVATDTKKSVALTEPGSYLLLRGWLQKNCGGAAVSQVGSLSDSTRTHPFDGTVTKRSVDMGESLS